eukprot:CAMPEP_0175592070 /NCGR_PEP_ID=MMETSP0096-20121207/53204_1 /TAXON_ID=311494 /ORGANISM="Alexandrium monilatum, Strain CCMP3105" /LENGTH=57 /DNA_ID=CAMNT_0016896245 /DNA_START=107 /DNA_END=277 /DNA_ORIENTATION=+
MSRKRLSSLNLGSSLFNTLDSPMSTACHVSSSPSASSSVGAFPSGNAPPPPRRGGRA